MTVLLLSDLSDLSDRSDESDGSDLVCEMWVQK